VGFGSARGFAAVRFPEWTQKSSNAEAGLPLRSAHRVYLQSRRPIFCPILILCLEAYSRRTVRRNFLSVRGGLCRVQRVFPGDFQPNTKRVSNWHFVCSWSKDRSALGAWCVGHRKALWRRLFFLSGCGDGIVLDFGEQSGFAAFQFEEDLLAGGSWRTRQAYDKPAATAQE